MLSQKCRQTSIRCLVHFVLRNLRGSFIGSRNNGTFRLRQALLRLLLCRRLVNDVNGFLQHFHRFRHFGLDVLQQGTQILE